MNVDKLTEQARRMYEGSAREKDAFAEGMKVMHMYLMDSGMILDYPMTDADVPSIMNYINKTNNGRTKTTKEVRELLRTCGQHA